MVVVIDYGLNNINSITSKLHRSGVDVIGTDNVKIIEQAKKLILPGVGHFAAAMQSLKDKGIIDVLQKKVLIDEIPILGICLGSQLFASKSEEGNVNGLNFINANIKRFSCANLKIPHVGWSRINIKKDLALFDDIAIEKRYYFTHSYHYECDNKYIVATTEYGYAFPSIIQKNNILGVQFHPEKSHLSGFKLIENFVKIL